MPTRRMAPVTPKPDADGLLVANSKGR